MTPLPPLRFGIFLAPFHPVREDPTGALDRDMALVEWLDELRFDEAWIGEHHSAAYEIISSSEIFMAVAAERIRLGTGVVSLPSEGDTGLRREAGLVTGSSADGRSPHRRTGSRP